MVSRKMLAPEADVSDEDVENTQAIEASDSKLDKLPKILASTKKGTRHKGMQALALWLTSREPSEEDLKKVWKGLFYAVWHADKAPVQEELINRVAGLMLSLSEESARRFLQVRTTARDFLNWRLIAFREPSCSYYGLSHSF
jgi:hypothetical protein